MAAWFGDLVQTLKDGDLQGAVAKTQAGLNDVTEGLKEKLKEVRRKKNTTTTTTTTATSSRESRTSLQTLIYRYTMCVRVCAAEQSGGGPRGGGDTGAERAALDHAPSLW